MKKEFLGLEGDSMDERSWALAFHGPTFESAKMVNFRERKLVVVQAFNGEVMKPYVIVPGYRDGETYTNEYGQRCVMVETVLKEEQIEIERLLKTITEGPVNFW